MPRAELIRWGRLGLRLVLRVWSLGLGFGVWVWGLGSGLGSLEAFYSVFMCQRHVQRGGGYDSEGTEIDGGGDGNHGVPSHQRRRHTDLDQGGRREG